MANDTISKSRVNVMIDSSKPPQITFPQYRKLSDRAYYKIVSETELFEIQRLGQRYARIHLVAQNFLDRNLIADILDGDNGRYEKIAASEYESIKG